MTDLKVAVASVLAAAVFLLSAVGAGRGYRTASDLTLQAITAGSAAPPVARASSERRPSRQPETAAVTPRAAGARPSSGSLSASAPSSAPAPLTTSVLSSVSAPASTPVPSSSTTPAFTSPPVVIEREVTYGSPDEYESEYKEYGDGDKAESDDHE